MVTVEMPPEMAPFIQRLQTDPNDYEANKAVALYLRSKPETHSQSLNFFARALSHNRASDPDHRSLLETYSETLFVNGEFESAIKPLEVLLTTYPTDVLYMTYLAHAGFRSGRVEMASDAAKTIDERFYTVAKKEAEKSGEPITQVLEPRQILRSHFGELAIKLDLYAKARILGLIPETRALLPVLGDDVVNPCLYECLKLALNEAIVFPSSSEERDGWIGKYQGKYFLDNYVDADGRGLDMPHFLVSVQRQWEEDRRGPLVTLPDKFDEKGWNLLQERGMPRGAWFVCLRVRTSGYRPNTVSANVTHYRNSEIEDYFPAIDAVRDRGGWVVRLGDHSMPPLPDMEGVIDYAVSDWREDWIDVFLLARNRFFVGVPSGPNAVAHTFGVPIVEINRFPFNDWLANSNVISIFKLYRRVSDGGYLTIEEMTSPAIRSLFSKSDFDAKGIEIVDNSPEEIRDTVVEMMDRLQGVTEYTAEDDELQERFEAAVDLFKVGVNIRIGRDYLNKHRSLLG